jgi:hypothetical protein
MRERRAVDSWALDRRRPDASVDRKSEWRVESAVKSIVDDVTRGVPGLGE